MEPQVEFAASPDLEVPDLREVAGGTERLPEQHLSDAYFDTADRRLWQRGITLRHRLEETPPGARPAGTWTLDLRVDRVAGPRELRWIGDRSEIPTEARRVLRGLVRRETLETVSELNTFRRRVLLRNRQGRNGEGETGPGGTGRAEQGQGEIWAEVDDDTVTVHHGPQDGLSFRQLRVDLVGTENTPVTGAGAAAHTQLGPVLAELRQAGARRSDDEQLGNILGAGRPEPQGRARHLETGSIAAVVAATIASDLDRLLDPDVALRLDPRHPPVRAIHQTRVATRRLRSDLKTLAPLLDPVWVRHTRAELKSAGEALGLIRDADVLAKRLGLTSDAGPAGEGMLTLARRLDDERDLAAVALAGMIESEQYLNLLDRLHAASLRPPLLAASSGNQYGAETPAAEALPPLIHEQWKTLRRRVRHAGEHPSDTRLHRIRIGAKQLRYASELAEPVAGKPARQSAAAAQALQDLLGDHHDLVTAQAWLRTTAQGMNADPAAAFTAGVLAAGQQRRAAEVRGEWPAAWSRMEKKLRRWMG